jgi:NitT/TauT family transport system substrate-binding protein
VAVAGVGGPDYLVLQAWLEHQGVDADAIRYGEIRMEQQLAALAEGRVAAALLAEPYLSVALERGARIVGAPYADPYLEPLGGLPLSYFVAEAGWLQTHGDVARRFAQAVHRTHAELQANPAAHREAALGERGLAPAVAARVGLPTLATHVTVPQLQAWADLMGRPQPGQAAASPAHLTISPDLLFDTVR